MVPPGCHRATPFPSGSAARYVGEIATRGTGVSPGCGPRSAGLPQRPVGPDDFGCPLRASGVLSPRRYFRCPADSSELAYDPPVVMNADTLGYCQKEAWCKLAFYLLSFFYYLYW